MAGKVQLAWAEVGGELRHVSDYVGTPAGKRPRAVCPACREDLTMRLGSVVAHHYAHRPRATCALREGESALHYNAKLWVAAELRRALERDPSGPVIQSRFPCTYMPNYGTPEFIPYCEGMHSADWATGWDGLAVERSVGSRRPDVLLTRGGAPHAAIEILVSHAVDDEKAEDLQRLGIPWVQLPAERILPAKGTPWRLPRALPASGASDPGGWLCKRHEAEAERKEQERIRREQEREERRRQREERYRQKQERCDAERRIQEMIDSAERREWLARVLDVYLPDGTLRRERWVMVAAMREGRAYAVELCCADWPKPIGRYLSAGRGTKERCARELDAALRRHVEDGRRLGGGLVEVMTMWERASDLTAEAAESLPYRYAWDRTLQKWVRRRG